MPLTLRNSEVPCCIPMEPNTATIIKDEILALGDCLVEYHDWRCWQSIHHSQPKPEKDLRQNIEDQEEVVFFHFEQSQGNDLWKPLLVDGKPEWFRIRLISLLVAKVVSGNALNAPVIDIIKTCRSLGDEGVDLDTALKKIVDMIQVGLLTIEERFPPYLISSHVSLSPQAMDTFASKMCLVKPSEIPTPKPDQEASKKKRKAPDLTPTCPWEIYAKLREHVIDQDQAAKTLACRGYMHIKRSQLLRKGQDIGKNECLLMIGPSGTGKTFLCEEFGKFAMVPVCQHYGDRVLVHWLRRPGYL